MRCGRVETPPAESFRPPLRPGMVSHAMRNASGNFSKSLSASPEAFQRLSAQEGARGCGHAGVRDQLCGSFARTPLCGRGKRLRKGSASHGFTDSDSDFNGFGAVGLRPPAEGFRPPLRLGKGVHAMRNASRNFPKSFSAPEAFQRLSAQERRGSAMWACGNSCVGRLRGRRFADAESGLKRIRFAHSTDYGVRLHECGAFGLKSPLPRRLSIPAATWKGRACDEERFARFSQIAFRVAGCFSAFPRRDGVCRVARAGEKTGIIQRIGTNVTIDKTMFIYKRMKMIIMKLCDITFG